MIDQMIIYVLGSLVVFLLGVGGGWLMTRDNVGFDRSDLRKTIAVVVTVVWASTIIVEIIVPTYTVSILIHGIMGAVVGYLFSEEGMTVNIGGG